MHAPTPHAFQHCFLHLSCWALWGEAKHGSDDGEAAAACLVPAREVDQKLERLHSPPHTRGEEEGQAGSGSSRQTWRKRHLLISSLSVLCQEAEEGALHTPHAFPTVSGDSSSTQAKTWLQASLKEKRLFACSLGKRRGRKTCSTSYLLGGCRKLALSFRRKTSVCPSERREKRGNNTISKWSSHSPGGKLKNLQTLRHHTCLLCHGMAAAWK